MRIKTFALALAAVAALAAGPAGASLTSFATFNGNVGYSSDGFGSGAQSGTISASVPVGSTVLAAFLYTSTFSNGAFAGVGGTFNGNAVSYTALGVNAASCCALRAGRTDVTAIVRGVVDGGPGGVYNFTVTETSGSQDGEALVVVFSNPALAESTVGILDGFASVLGDTTSINFLNPLDKTVPGFVAELALGIGFSFNSGNNPGQVSRVNVNGTTMTLVAGNFDDGAGANGALITVGSFDDPITPANPTVLTDHERYDLNPFINNGDTVITLDTINGSRDDNIFLAVIHVTGEAGVNAPPPSANVPEPGTLVLLGLGILGLALGRRRRS